MGSALVRALAAERQVLSITTGRGLLQSGSLTRMGWEHPGLKDLLKQATVFVHTAGKVQGSPQALQSANVAAVQRYLTLLPANLQQIIHFSSANVHLSEPNAYARSKAAGEEVWQASPFAGRLVILQPTLIYGPGDCKNIYRLIRLVDRFPALPLPSTGKLRPVFIDDVVHLVCSLIEEQAGKGGTWIVSGKEVTDFRDMAERIAKHLGKKRLLLPIPGVLLSAAVRAAGIAGKRDLEQQARNYQMDKIWHDSSVWERLPGRTVPLDDGLRRSIAAYQKMSQVSL